MTRTRIALTVTTLGLAGLLGLTGCGSAGAGPSAAPAVAAADVTGEAYALTEVGFETGMEAAPAASEEPKSGKPKERKQGLRKQLRKNILHGETTVRAKDGVRTIVVQRGTVTAVDGRTVSVRSTDGFSQTWTFGDKVKVLQNRKAVDVNTLKNGVEIGVAGAKDGDRATARLIAIR
ncbi:hypothetical protein BG844_07875 [Couchioplanes caeruleus subsp. caeruleus]|uniref:DUF5666 domain-containing protein n=2 Tax=Couchioplanes caeruleus TaxID=56438 RepID=A0A1K0FPT8_9ACTN|nr:hypothetical protein BG844_07875 [Couchioplanes caeruleus subsp. caeruleus]